MPHESFPCRRSVQVGSITLSYLEWLHEGGEPVLLLHGLADSAEVWRGLGDCLGHHYHVVAVDIRGHGDSDKPKTGYQFADIIADANALMAELGWDSAHILGHSWSGKTVSLWARQQPYRFRSAILIDPAFMGTFPSWIKPLFPVMYRMLSFLKGMGPFDSLDQAEQQARQLKQYRDWTPRQQAVFRASIECHSDGVWRSKFTREARDGIFDDVMRVAALTETIAVPALTILPEQGLNRFEWQITPFRTYFPNGRVQRVPGNHWPFLVEPIAFNHAIETFLLDQPNFAANE